MRRSGSNNRSSSRGKQKGPSNFANRKPLILTRSGAPSDFSWSLRGADTHTVSQVYLSLFASLSQIPEALPPSVRVVPDTIIFSANNGPTTWFAFDHKLRKVQPHAAIHTTTANILRYFTEVMRSREILDMSKKKDLDDDQFLGSGGGDNSKNHSSGSPRFPCAVWMFDAVDVRAHDQSAEQDRHVCVEYLDLAGVQALVDRVVSGQAPPNGVLQEYVASETPSAAGSSEEVIATIQIPPPQNNQQDDGNNNNNRGNNHDFIKPGITSPTTGLLEFTSVNKFRNLHLPRDDSLNTATSQQQQQQTPINATGFSAIPPYTLVYQTSEGINADLDNLTSVVRESEDVVQELRLSSPGWSVSTVSNATSVEPMLPSTNQIQDSLKMAYHIVTALTRDRDHLGELNSAIGSGVSMVPFTKCCLWLKPLSKDNGGGFALLGVTSLRIPTIRLDYTFIDADNIVSIVNSGGGIENNNKDTGYGSARRAAAAKKNNSSNNNNNNNRSSAAAGGRHAPSRQTTTRPVARSVSPAPSPGRQQQQQHQHQQRTFTPRPVSAQSSNNQHLHHQSQRSTPIPQPPSSQINQNQQRSVRETQGVRHQDIQGLSRNPTTVEQNVDRMFEHNNNNNNNNSQLPPRPQSATMNSMMMQQQQQQRQQQQPHSQNPSGRPTPIPPPTRPTSANANNNSNNGMMNFASHQQQLQQQLAEHSSSNKNQHNNFRSGPPPPTSSRIGDQENHHPNAYNNNHNSSINNNQQQQIEHVFFSKVTEHELAGLKAAETVQMKAFTQLEQPEEVSCPNCGEWQLRNECYSLNYHTIASAVVKSRKRNEKHLKKVFPRRGKFTAQRSASSLDDVRNSHSENILFDDHFEWAPVPPVLKQLSVEVDEIVAREIWRQRKVVLCGACAYDLYDKEDAELTDKLDKFLNVQKNAWRTTGSLMKRGSTKDNLDLSIRAASPEQAGVDYLVGNNHTHQEGKIGGATLSSFAIPPFNAAHSQIAARHSIHERPPPASVFSNVTDALVTTDLQMQHREIRQARRDKYAMRLVAADCHRGVDVFSATLAKQREISSLIDSLILPIQDLGISSQIDDPLSLILSRELFQSITKVCKEPAELALGVVMSRPAKGKGPWRIPKPISAFGGDSSTSSSSKKKSGDHSTSYEDDLALLEADGDVDEDLLEFSPLAIGEERKNHHKKGSSSRRVMFSSNTKSKSGSTSKKRKTFDLDDENNRRNSSRAQTYHALCGGSQTFAEMNQNERDAIVQFLGSEGSELNNDDDE